MSTKWSKKELSILTAVNGPPSSLERVFLANGFSRSASAIAKKIRELKEIKTGNLDDLISESAEEYRGPKVLFYDIEATDLSAGFGEMICFGYSWMHESQVHVRNMYDYEGWHDLPVEDRDLYLLQDIDDLFEEADVIVGHYSTKYDLPFIQTRRLIHGLPLLPVPIHIDTWKLSKNYLKLNNNRMKTIAEGLRLDERKGGVSLLTWRRAKAHDLQAMKDISIYNLQDVRTQKAMGIALFPFTKIMPNWNVFSDEETVKCQSCGSEHLQHRGYVYTKQNKFKRFQCQQCGKWMRSKVSETSKETTRLV